MKHVTYFGQFLADTVNLNKSRLDNLSDSVDAVYSALRSDSEIGGSVVGKTPQGSWAHKTIIEPQGNNEFDADFLLEFSEVEEWADHPRTYINEVEKALARHPTYGEMPRERKCRCVRLTYKNDYHLDIVPYLRLADGREVIVNRDDDEWEPTNPTGFTDWIRTKDGIAEGNLRKVIRLIKYLRDSKRRFVSTRSVILTTLVGERVSEAAKIASPGYYSDVPTTLVHVVEDLNSWLQANETKPSVPDPSQSGATFDHRWDNDAYENLRDRMNEYAAKMRAAFDEEDADTSVQLWQELFGDGFGPPPKKASAGVFGVAAGPPTRSGRAG